jgi:signal transduction histidine kinase
MRAARAALSRDAQHGSETWRNPYVCYRTERDPRRRYHTGLPQCTSSSLRQSKKGPVMLEKGGDSDILDDAVAAGRSTEALQGFEPSDRPTSDLLARMSHELRTPLSVILGFAQLLESGRPIPTDSQKRSIDKILQAGWYLEKLINMTRDLALIEAGKLSLSLEPVPLAAVMLECQAMIESQAQVRGVRVTFPLFESPCSVSADRIRLQEVLSNMLSAAIDHSDVDGTVAVHCEIPSAEWIRIGIDDDGEGSSVEGRRHSLQPLDGREQNSTAVDETGIGLLLARRLVGMMGGAIGTESVDGAGKLFSFDLKRMLVPTAPVPTSTHSAFGEAAIPNGGRPQSMIHSPDNLAHPR